MSQAAVLLSSFLASHTCTGE